MPPAPGAPKAPKPGMPVPPAPRPRRPAGSAAEGVEQLLEGRALERVLGVAAAVAVVVTGAWSGVVHHGPYGTRALSLHQPS